MFLDRTRVALNWLRRIPSRWQRFGLIVSALVLCELGARLPLPGLNSEALRDFLRHDSGGALRSLYDFLAGGALSRGAILGLGILPYLSARIMMRLARTAIPALDRQLEGRVGSGRATKWTRVLTTGLAVVQSYGFARFTQNVPGAVANPGASYLVPTVLLLTGGAVLMMLLSERILGHSADETTADVGTPTHIDVAGSPPVIALNVPPTRALNAPLPGVADRVPPARTPIPVPLHMDRTNDL